MIRPATADDAAAIVDIYNHYILNTVVSFEEEAVSVAEIQDRMKRFTARFPWLVYEEDGRVLGYAYAAPWHTRASYRNTAESTVYLAQGAAGRGLGSQLYGELFERLHSLKVHAVMAGITLPNPASVALHEKMGFEKVGHHKEVGWKFDRWIDVGYWQLLL